MNAVFRIIVVIVGIVLLLPGLCSIAYDALVVMEGNGLELALLSIPGLISGALGVWILRAVFKKKTPQAGADTEPASDSTEN